ncbi:MAG TPA: hypothetical protein VKB09_10125, partial [Thermomicrobiales bacterium]|nr:hypothetical protein [Thermomicrobiales bacterium]
GRREGPRVQAQQSTDDLRATLAAANTLPMFGVGADDPPLTATQGLRVDDGAIVLTFDESARSAAARQRDVDDVIFAMSLEQPLTVSTPLIDGYDLTLSATQHVFGSEEDGRRFITETAERIGRGRPQVTLTELDTGQDEQSYTYEDGDLPNGTAYGFLTHAYVTGGSFAAVVAVDLAAVPTGRGRAPLDSADLQQNLGPLVAQIVTTLSDCLISPAACPSTVVLTTGPSIVPQPTPTQTPRATATPTGCPDNLQECGADCVDTSSDHDNCGQCDNGCGELSCCSSVCIDVSSDSNNCGECQAVCDPGLVCVEGLCTCADGADYCDGACVDLSSDANNCGECAFVCPSGQVCADGKCTCPDDSIPCADSCCDPALECADGVCVEPCDPPYQRCNGTCIDPSTDQTNCGACGNVCSTGDECQFGECVAVPG